MSSASDGPAEGERQPKDGSFQPREARPHPPFRYASPPGHPVAATGHLGHGSSPNASLGARRWLSPTDPGGPAPTRGVRCVGRTQGDGFGRRCVFRPFSLAANSRFRAPGLQGGEGGTGPKRGTPIRGERGPSRKMHGSGTPPSSARRSILPVQREGILGAGEMRTDLGPKPGERRSCCPDLRETKQSTAFALGPRWMQWPDQTTVGSLAKAL